MKNERIIKSVLIIVVFLAGTILFFKNKKRLDEHLLVSVLLTGTDEVNRSDKISPYWLVDSLNVGDSELSISGKKNAEIMNIESYEEGNNKISILTLKLIIKKNKKLNVYKYKEKELYVGSVIELHLGNTRTYAKVVEIFGDEMPKQEYKRVEVNLLRIGPWLADKCRVGDKTLSRLDGENYVEILSKKVTFHEYNDSVGRIVTDSRYRDMKVELKVGLRERGGVDYFAFYQPVKVGNKIYVPMNGYNLYEAEVMSVDEYED